MCVNHRQTVYMCRRVYISWQTTDENRPANSFGAAGIWSLRFICFVCMFMHIDLSYRTLSSHATLHLNGVFTVYMFIHGDRDAEKPRLLLSFSAVYIYTTKRNKWNVWYFKISRVKCLTFRSLKVRLCATVYNASPEFD